MTKFVPAASLPFDDVLYNQRWPVKVPRFLHEYHGWWDYWEIERNLSMEKHLKPGMVLWDVGAFDGWLAAVYQKFVGGPENIVLIEPMPEQWSNTRATWEANGLGAPRYTYRGFIGDTVTQNWRQKVKENEWPDDIDYSQIIKSISFKFLHEPKDRSSIECTTIDALADMIDAPDAITIDIEGAEYIALYGAAATCLSKRPLIWVAIHPEFVEWRYKIKPLKLHKMMYDLDYECVPISTDHEDHWAFFPKEKL